ncbi:MAG: AAA family ATPase [Saprospiraceae bacterium]|nr:AAA family ATPase [Saprospiraceae bacterium]
MKKQNSKTLPYTIRDINISDFKGIKNIEVKNLPSEAKWIFLTGENGYGKTSILQAIALGLAGIDQATVGVIEIPHNPEICVTLNNGEKYEVNERSFEKIFKQSRDESNYFKRLACYGSSRLDTYSESSQRVDKNSNISNLFSSQSLLENIELKLSRWYAKQDITEFRNKYETTRKLLMDLLDLYDLKVDINTDKVTYIEQDEEGNPFSPVDFSQLASGYKSIIATMGDMILRLFEAYPENYDPRQLSAIVIIDELDLHFHPKWQKRLPGLFSKYFPNIQFVASTHSPIPLLGAPRGSVFLTVKRTQQEGITVERLNHLESTLSTMTPNLLLDSPIFGYADLFSSQFRKNQYIKTETTTEEVEMNEKIQSKLKKGLSDEKKKQLSKYLKS